MHTCTRCTHVRILVHAYMYTLYARAHTGNTHIQNSFTPLHSRRRREERRLTPCSCCLAAISSFSSGFTPSKHAEYCGKCITHSKTTCTDTHEQHTQTNTAYTPYTHHAHREDRQPYTHTAKICTYRQQAAHFVSNSSMKTSGSRGKLCHFKCGVWYVVREIFVMFFSALPTLIFALTQAARGAAAWLTWAILTSSKLLALSCTNRMTCERTSGVMTRASKLMISSRTEGEERNFFMLAQLVSISLISNSTPDNTSWIACTHRHRQCSQSIPRFQYQHPSRVSLEIGTANNTGTRRYVWV